MRSVEDRLKALEALVKIPRDPGIFTSSFTAQEYQTCIVSSRGTGLTCLFPKATPQNNNAWIQLVNTTSTLVTLRANSGLVNGQSSVAIKRIGTFYALSDGTTGWFITSVLPDDLRGIGLTIDSSEKLRPRIRPRLLQECERFISGGTTTGIIGKLGWTLLGVGTPVYTRFDGTSAGGTNRSQLATSGAANDTAILCLGETATRVQHNASELQFIQFSSGMNSSTTSKRIFFGLTDDATVEPSAMANCLGIYADTAVASGNWQILARKASAGSPTDTGSAPPATAAQLFTILQNTSGGFGFYIGNTLVGTLASASIPTTAMNIAIRLQTLTAASRNHRIGTVNWESNLAGALNDDDFMEF